MASGSVVVNVFDESTGGSSRFQCDSTTLLSSMRYFQEHVKQQVPAGQTVEISVHCDAAIFSWLFAWVQAQQGRAQQPQLMLQNVLPVLISSNFLRMEALVRLCLTYISSHLVQICAQPNDLSLLPPEIMHQLAAMVTLPQLEEMSQEAAALGETGRSRATVVLNKMYKYRLEMLLKEHKPSISCCSQCHSLFNLNEGSRLQCGAAACAPPQAAQEQAAVGSAPCRHEAEPSWKLQRYLTDLRARMVPWRDIYWSLWAVVQVLYCQHCLQYFPASEVGQCSTHSAEPMYLAGRPTGRYPCCGTKATRSGTVQLYSPGCCTVDHQVLPIHIAKGLPQGGSGCSLAQLEAAAGNLLPAPMLAAWHTLTRFRGAAVSAAAEAARSLRSSGTARGVVPALNLAGLQLHSASGGAMGSTMSGRGGESDVQGAAREAVQGGTGEAEAREEEAARAGRQVEGQAPGTTASAEGPDLGVKAWAMQRRAAELRAAALAASQQPSPPPPAAAAGALPSESFFNIGSALAATPPAPAPAPAPALPDLLLPRAEGAAGASTAETLGAAPLSVQRVSARQPFGWLPAPAVPVHGPGSGSGLGPGPAAAGLPQAAGRKLKLELLHEDDMHRMDSLVKHLMSCRPAVRAGSAQAAGSGSAHQPGPGQRHPPLSPRLQAPHSPGRKGGAGGGYRGQYAAGGAGGDLRARSALRSRENLDPGREGGVAREGFKQRRGHGHEGGAVGQAQALLGAATAANGVAGARQRGWGAAAGAGGPKRSLSAPRPWPGLRM